MNCRNHVDVSEGIHRCNRCGGDFCRDCLVYLNGAPYCATCKMEQLLDVRSGVAGVINVASIGRRFLASLVDGLITGVPALIFYFILFGTMTRLGPRVFSPLFWIPSVLAIIYQAAMLQARGQTLGKMALRIKVVRPDGSNISGGQAWGREVSRAFLGLLYLVDYLPALFTEERRTIHDMLAKTRVVNWNP